MDILDTSALLALIRKEKGGDKISALMAQSKSGNSSVFIHAVNFIELMYKCRQLYGEKVAHKIVADLHSPFLGVVNYMDTDLNLYAARLKAEYKMSLGDAIGLAHAKIMKGTFWTADTALQEIAEKENILLRSIR